ncbi:MAG: ATP-binding cassette domain-containing protein [Rubrobacter sp.]|nr:ATP-binding cassette domain-containing protein [Rubrobacter sp.]
MTSSQRDNALEIRGVSVAFGKNLALDDVSLAVEPGERLAVIGTSGAGKSTLFRAITRDVGVSGEIRFGDRRIHTLSKRELREVRGSVGKIHQAYNLVPQLPAGVNAALGDVVNMGKLRTLHTFLAGPNTALAKTVEAAMERVGLAGMSSAKTSNLSGGQQQRVAVARLLVQRPGLILADEPFAAVDPVTTERVFDALLELNKDGASLLISLHDVELAKRFPRVVALKEGSVVYDGSPEHLTNEKLNDIYDGDMEARPKGKEPEEPGPDNFSGPDITRLKGQDGISAH